MRGPSDMSQSCHRSSQFEDVVMVLDRQHVCGAGMVVIARGMWVTESGVVFIKLCVMSTSLVSCQCYRITVKGRRQIHCDLATPHGHRQRRSIEQITNRTLACIMRRAWLELLDLLTSSHTKLRTRKTWGVHSNHGEIERPDAMLQVSLHCLVALQCNVYSVLLP